MNRTMAADFKNPGSAFRAKPFWAWNGKLDEMELRRQIRAMQRMGLGGFFMHSRVGLDTHYLSDEWFRMVGACVDEARKNKMEAWLYDEDRWPSGAAGGLVTRNKNYRARTLVMDELARPADLRRRNNWLAVFIARRNDAGTLAYARRIARPAAARLKRGELLLAFRQEMMPDSSWFNGFTYLDTLNPAAVREFIRVTHAQYARRFGKQFGKVIPGIFTDEPHHGPMFNHALDIPGIPWTGALPEIFRRRYGYDLLPHLPELFYDIDGESVSQPRYHYHDCLSWMFSEYFCRQIGDWCARHNLPLTGHLLGEDSLTAQTDTCGDCMRAYAHMQIPGMDLLTERGRIYNTAKQVASVAHQFGRKWRLTETYGCTGWDFSFEGHKALGDWQAALGINLRCQHLSWFTMAGSAKRDYPASIFQQSPWWDSYGKVEDYFARINTVMTRGEEVRDLLVIHPVESAWLLYQMQFAKKHTQADINKKFIKLTEYLLQHQLDFDFGAESLLLKHGRVQTGSGGARLVVKRAAYTTVLVPEMLTMRSSTLRLLKNFAAAGGRVVFLGAPPTLLDARPSNLPAGLAANCAQVSGMSPALIRTLDPACRRIKITDEAGKPVHSALYLLRQDADAYYLLVVNTSHSRAQLKRFMDVRVCERRTAWREIVIRGFAGCAGAPQAWAPESGQIFAAKAHKAPDGAWEIRAPFHRLASHVFVIPKQPFRAHLPPVKAPRKTKTIKLPAGQRPIAMSEPNVLALDRPAFRINRGQWQPADEILRIDRQVREKLGLPLRSGRMIQPWARPAETNPAAARVELRYAINVQHPPSGRLHLAIEQPADFDIRLNGLPLPAETDAGWWCDQSLRLLPVDPALLQIGANELSLSNARYTARSNLEIIYLLGNFGVALRGTDASLTRPPAALKLGDWTRQGLPFYSGNLTYLWHNVKFPRIPGAQCLLRIPAFRGTAIRVLVNGRPAGIAAWPPYEVDITDHCSNSPVSIGVEILGHRRNSHGPLHHAEKWPRWTGPAEFETRDALWQEDYQLVPCGLMAPPEIVT